MDNVAKIYGEEKRVLFSQNNYEALKNADALIILTEWDEFRMPNYEKMQNLMAEKIIIDGRNIWNKQEMLEMWFTYEWIGK